MRRRLFGQAHQTRGKSGLQLRYSESRWGSHNLDEPQERFGRYLKRRHAASQEWFDFFSPAVTAAPIELRFRHSDDKPVEDEEDEE